MEIKVIICMLNMIDYILMSKIASVIKTNLNFRILITNNKFLLKCKINFLLQHCNFNIIIVYDKRKSIIILRI